jgi:type IV secretion system protein VirD4
MGFVQEAAGKSTALPPNAGSPIADDSEAHCLVVAPTGQGKGRSLVLPNLLTWPHSAIVVDVKGEAAQTTARYRRSIGHRVTILDPFRRVSEGVDGLNPLDWLQGSKDEIADNASTLSETLTGSERSLREPFWDCLSNDFAAGLLAYAATSDDPAKRQMAFVHQMLTSEESEYRIAVILDNEPHMNAYARMQFAGFLQHEGEKVRSSVRSTTQQHLRIFANPLVQQVVSKTTVDLEGLQRGEPHTIYLVLPATRLQSHAALLRLWLSVLLGTIAERDTQPLAPTLLVLDEMAQIGALPIVLQALTLLRGYGLRVMAIVQSLAQLRAMWPQDFQTVIDNCGTIATFGQTRLTMAQPMAELLGDVSADSLMRLPQGQLAISMSGERTRVAKKLDYLHDGLFAGRFDPNAFYARQSSQPHAHPS